MIIRVLLTVSDINMAKTNPLRTYRARKEPTPSCTILEAAKAVISSPGVFHPVQIGSGAHVWGSIDAKIRYPNPIQELLRQAQDHFGRDEQVATILSVGAGKVKVNSLGKEYDPNRSLDDVLRRMIEDGEEKHEEMYGRLGNSGIYFRLNVERGLEQASCWSEESISTIKAHTETYLQIKPVSDLVDDVVTSLHLQRPRVSLKQISK